MTLMFTQLNGLLIRMCKNLFIGPTINKSLIRLMSFFARNKSFIYVGDDIAVH